MVSEIYKRAIMCINHNILTSKHTERTVQFTVLYEKNNKQNKSDFILEITKFIFSKKCTQHFKGNKVLVVDKYSQIKDFHKNDFPEYGTIIFDHTEMKSNVNKEELINMMMDVSGISCSSRTFKRNIIHLVDEIKNVDIKNIHNSDFMITV